MMAMQRQRQLLCSAAFSAKSQVHSNTQQVTSNKLSLAPRDKQPYIPAEHATVPTHMVAQASEIVTLGNGSWWQMQRGGA